MKQFRNTRYYIKDNGEVWNSNFHRQGIMKQMKTKIKNEGYEGILITVENNKKHFLVHRMVAECFLDNWDESLTVNHKDFDKSNNHVDNLEMMTLSENLNHFKKYNPKFYFSKVNSSRKGKTYEEIYGEEKAKEIKMKRSKESKGKKHSEETKEKIRQKSLLYRHSQETKDKISKSKKGKPSPIKGVKLTEEHKLKLKEAWKKRKIRKNGNNINNTTN